MADTKFFKYLGDNSYRKYSSDHKKIYAFSGGNPVAVDLVADQAQFACNVDFVETDETGKLIDPTIPSRNKKQGEPLSYRKMGVKEEEKSSSKTTISKGKEGAKVPEAEEDGSGKDKTPAKKKKAGGKKS